MPTPSVTNTAPASFIAASSVHPSPSIDVPPVRSTSSGRSATRASRHAFSASTTHAATSLPSKMSRNIASSSLMVIRSMALPFVTLVEEQVWRHPGGSEKGQQNR
jgi:hypothetical protein